MDRLQSQGIGPGLYLPPHLLPTQRRNSICQKHRQHICHSIYRDVSMLHHVTSELIYPVILEERGNSVDPIELVEDSSEGVGAGDPEDRLWMGQLLNKGIHYFYNR